MTKTLFFFFAILVAFVTPPLSAHADGTKIAVCNSNCQAWHEGHGSAPYGQTACVDSFVPPSGTTKFMMQLYDEKGEALFKDKQGNPTPRGGVGTTRVGVGCSIVEKTYKLTACIEGPKGPLTTTLFRHEGQTITLLKDARFEIPF